MSDYFTKLNKKFDNLSDEELNKILNESGIDDCPYDMEEYEQDFVESYSRTFDLEMNASKRKSIRMVTKDDSLMNYSGRERVA